MDEGYVQEHFDFWRYCRAKSEAVRVATALLRADSESSELSQRDQSDNRAKKGAPTPITDSEDRQHGDPPICSRTSRAHHFGERPALLLAR
jgi:hypothetical protein